MSYREHRPPAALSPWLACTWERVGEPGGPPVRVLPDGCIDVLWTESGSTRLVGANTVAFVSPVAAGGRVVGARLRPGGAPALLGIDAERLRDARPDVATVLGDDGRRLADALDRAVDPVAELRGWLARRGPSAGAPDPLVGAVVAGDGRLGPLADALGVSERGLRRRVTAAVGYGPKRLMRVLRLRRALAAARAGDDLARVAFDAGYADQAHLCHDCRELAGVTPTALVGGRFAQDAAPAGWNRPVP